MGTLERPLEELIRDARYAVRQDQADEKELATPSAENGSNSESTELLSGVDPSLYAPPLFIHLQPPLDPCAPGRSILCPPSSIILTIQTGGANVELTVLQGSELMATASGHPADACLALQKHFVRAVKRSNETEQHIVSFLFLDECDALLVSPTVAGMLALMLDRLSSDSRIVNGVES
jgi:hypothetical protein